MYETEHSNDSENQEAVHQSSDHSDFHESEMLLFTGEERTEEHIDEVEEPPPKVRKRMGPTYNDVIDIGKSIAQDMKSSNNIPLYHLFLTQLQQVLQRGDLTILSRLLSEQSLHEINQMLPVQGASGSSETIVPRIVMPLSVCRPAISAGRPTKNRIESVPHLMGRKMMGVKKRPSNRKQSCSFCKGDHKVTSCSVLNHLGRRCTSKDKEFWNALLVSNALQKTRGSLQNLSSEFRHIIVRTVATSPSAAEPVCKVTPIVDGRAMSKSAAWVLSSQVSSRIDSTVTEVILCLDMIKKLTNADE